MPTEVPLRVDIAGGWLDVPALAQPDRFIVNCTFMPGVSLQRWPYEYGGGLGGSAAKAILEGKDAIQQELLTAGWQDPAVILETGLCVWRSGPKPILDFKANPDWLAGKMLLMWTGKPHVTGDLLKLPRDYTALGDASRVARSGIAGKSITVLGAAIEKNYEVQLGEGMQELPRPHGVLACKYAGSGHGGYAFYLFRCQEDRAEFLESMDHTFKLTPIEPYMRVPWH